MTERDAWTDKIRRVGPHIDPDISPEDAAELMKAYDHTLDPAIIISGERELAAYLAADKSDPAPDADRVNAIHHPHCNPKCEPGAHWITDNDLDQHAHENNLRRECAECAADRVNVYAEAILAARDSRPMGTPPRFHTARAVIALADREQADKDARIAELTAEVERLRERVVLADQGAWKSTAMAAERALADERAKVARVEALHTMDGNTYLCEVCCEAFPCTTRVRLRDLAEQWDADADANEDTYPREARATRASARDLRAALAGPAEPEASETGLAERALADERAKVARVEALAEQWEEATVWPDKPDRGFRGAAARLRIALEGPAEPQAWAIPNLTEDEAEAFMDAIAPKASETGGDA
jgi:hypothetical protein